MDNFPDILNCYLAEHYPMFERCMFTAESDIDRATLIMHMISNADPLPTLSRSGPISQKNDIKANDFYCAGTSFFEAGKMPEALENYNKAILHASPNSEIYMQSFERRADVLSAMGLFKEGLYSAEHALKCTDIEPPDERILKKRMKYSEIYSAGAASSCPNDPLLLIRDEYLTSASNKVAMSTDASVGRLLKAKADIRTGEVIMIEEPYACKTDTDVCTNCWNCTKYCETPYPCTICCYAMFCSQNCLEEARKYHDFECPIMNLLVDQFQVDILFILAFHTFLIATEHGTKLNELKQKVDNIESELKNRVTYDSDDFIRIYNLKHHPTFHTADFYVYYTFLAGYTVCALSKLTNLFDDAEEDLQVFACSIILRCFLIASNNAQEVQDVVHHEPKYVGCAVFATFSLFNHSCDPNVNRHFFNQSLVLRANRPIKAGEELTISYNCIFSSDSFSSRQADLAPYNFTCNCMACKYQWPLYPLLSPLGIAFKKLMDSTNVSRYFRSLADFIIAYQYTWENGGMLLKNDAEFSHETMDFLCSFIDFIDEYFLVPWQRYTELQEALRLGFVLVPNFQRSTEDTDALNL